MSKWSPCWSGCPAKNGHLECLEYARENGCPWDEEMFDSSMDEETSDSDSRELVIILRVHSFQEILSLLSSVPFILIHTKYYDIH